MQCRKFDGSPEDWKLIHDICYNCNSNSLKRTYGYLQKMEYFTEDFFCDIFDETAFFAGIKCKNNIRCLAIAVNKEKQRKGFGRKILFYEMKKALRLGLNEITLRTSKTEDGIKFWTKMGAKITKRKDTDWEMKLRF